MRAQVSGDMLVKLALGAGLVLGALYLVNRATSAAGRAIDTVGGYVIDTAHTGFNFIDPTSPTGGLQTSAQTALRNNEAFTSRLTGDTAQQPALDAWATDNAFYNWLAPIVNPKSGGATGSW